MFIPNASCSIRRTASRNVYGEETLAPAVVERCGLVRLRNQAAHTTVRADSSATRGFADEHTADALILLGPKTIARLGDQLECQGMKIRINDIQPRLTADGRLEHYEVRGEFWE